MAKNELKYTLIWRLSKGKNKIVERFGSINYIFRYDGKHQFERATGMKCLKEEWDSPNQKFVGENAKMRNLQLLHVINLLEQQVMSFTLTGSTKLLGQPVYTSPCQHKRTLKLSRTLIEVVDEYNDFQSEKIRRFGQKKHLGNIEESTYNTYLKRRDCLLIPFLRLYRLEDIKITDVDVKFLERFDIWITSQPTKDGRSRGQGYATKGVKYIKTVMNFAVKEGYLENNKGNFYKTQKESPKPVKTLTKADIEKLESCEFMSKGEEKALDMFLFANETMLHYGDYMQLTENHIKTDRDGQKWLVKSRKKAIQEDRQVQRVPLSDKAMSLINKYGGIENMPKMTNGCVNEWLKIIANRVNLDKYVMFKMGRSAAISHAFNEKGMRGESILILAGWTTPRELITYLEPDLGNLKNEFLTPINPQNTNGNMYQI
jgi:Phage integrase SAM-like domain